MAVRSRASVHRVAPFGALPDHKVVDRHTVINGEGMRVAVLTYGARLQAMHVPDHEGRTANVVLGFDDLDGYIDETDARAQPYMGGAMGQAVLSARGFEDIACAGVVSLTPHAHWNLAEGAGPVDPIAAAILRDPASGRVLTISTTEPGLQTGSAVLSPVATLRSSWVFDFTTEER